MSQPVFDAVRALQTALRGPMIEAIVADGGYSRAMAEWALDAACEPFAERAIAMPPLSGRVALGLARSVASAPVRSIALCFLRGSARVDVRAPRSQRAVTALVGEALRARGLGCSVSNQDDSSQWMSDHLNHGVDHVLLFGGDDWIAQGAERARARGIAFEGRGHGLGCAWVDAARMSDAEVRALAWDFAAYDGEGCLSPQCVLCEPGPAAAALGERLARALAEIEARVGRGAIGRERLVFERGWRAGAAAAAQWFAAERGWSVSVIDAQDERVSAIGGRNVLVRAGDERAWLAQSARWLTTVGLDAARSGEIQTLRATGVSGRLCALGAMQSPPLDGEADPREPVR